MKKRLGCLHAHYSNIEYIDKVLSPFGIELLHFVDPGLMYCVMDEQGFHKLAAQRKVQEQIEWIARCDVDAILITCTNYIAILQEDQLSLTVPIIKIDEPYFAQICKTQQKQTLLFTNPATVNGTVERLNQYAKQHQKFIDVEVMIIDHTFDLLMKGEKEAYNYEISKFLHDFVHKKKVVSVAQLSMVDASQQFENQTAITIMNPLQSVVAAVLKQLHIKSNLSI